jgi:hypothetical protein
LASTRLPVATINLFTQWLIPPPKYHIEQLIPQVRKQATARLAHLIVIERGAEAARPLDQEEALQILLANSDDAYGFPPYPAIRHYLTRIGGQDLAAAERAIVEAALRDATCQLVARPALDWWRVIAEWFGFTANETISRAPFAFPASVEGRVVR